MVVVTYKKYCGREGNACEKGKVYTPTPQVIEKKQVKRIKPASPSEGRLVRDNEVGDIVTARDSSEADVQLTLWFAS